ncbi:MAG: sigma-70 family RNA polymerase sigma factor [Nakamurella sp.]
MTVLDLVPSSADIRPPDSSAHLLDELVQARDSGCAHRIASAERALVLEFIGVATRIARRQSGRGVEVEDLVQVARVGLVKAVRRWQPQPSGGFLQYAGPIVLGEVQRHIRDRSALIRLPRRVYELRPTIMDARLALERGGGTSTVGAIARAAGVGVSDVLEDVMSHGRSHPQSLQVIQNVDDRADRVCVRAESERTSAEDRAALRTAINGLSDRERQLLALRFFEDLSQQEIGDRIGLSQMQISRLLRAVFAKLRLMLADGAGSAS